MQARISTIMNEWLLQWPKVSILNKWRQQWYQYQHSRQSGVNNNSNSITFTELEDCRQEYLRLSMSGFFNDHKFPFWTGGVNNDTSINILDKVGSIITQNSITFTQLDDCRHEYLRIWMSGFFNDQKFPFWTGGVNNDTSINILDKVGSIITQNSIIFTELDNCRHDYLRLWMSGFFNDQSLQFWIRGVNNDTIINILDKVESIITPNSINLLS